MNTITARKVLASTVAARTALVITAQTLTGRKASAAWKAVAQADQAVNFAQADVEQATRREMVGASEAAIMAASLA